ncbi:hypothetical protein FS842_006972 [Serendipita sp. 407]|nr:hypothetical protein FRC20_005362 [Serendipita sp. 405]KAG9020872.1 hypothetical protein FS842_006972 [Serendipita sp. 407]
MPLILDQRETMLTSGIVQSYIAAKKLPEDITITRLTELFDAAGVVANIKIISPPEVQLQEDEKPSKTAIIVYYSDETARRALQDLDENMSLDLSRAIELQYFGPSTMQAVENELNQQALAKALQETWLGASTNGTKETIAPYF